MKKWGSLVWKDLRGSWPQLLLAVAAIAGLDAWLAYKARIWDNYNPGLAFGLSFLPLVAIFMWILVSGYFVLRGEWQSKTSLRMLTYPVTGATVLWAKLTALLIIGVLTVIASGLGSYAVALRTPTIATDTDVIMFCSSYTAWERTLTAALLILTVAAMVAFVIATGIFSFVVGTLVPRLCGLVATIVYALMVYVVSAFLPHIIYAASFIPWPSAPVYAPQSALGTAILGASAAEGIARKWVPLVPFWPAVIGTVLLILVAGAILDSEVDA